MSITDELRTGGIYRFPSNKRVFTEEELTAIADRIDIAHKHAIGYVDDRDPETMTENGWVRLPKDADGEYIHVGDAVTCGATVWTVAGLKFLGEGWGICCTVYNEHGGSGTSVYPPSDLRHYHAPTVEDVLREFTDEVWNRCCEGATASDSGIDELFAKYAAKLRLAGDE